MAIRLFKKPTPFVIQIRATVFWQGFYNQKTRTWIGVCQALNQNAIGDTWGELQACANEAMQLLFADLVRTNEFDSFLREHGWTAQNSLAAASRAPLRFDVPTDWKQQSRYEELAHSAVG